MNQEIIKLFFTNFLLPIVLGILAFIASNGVNTWRSRRRQSLVGSVILQSFIEEVANGVAIMESVQGLLNEQKPKMAIGPLPRASWSSIQSISDDLLERIICTSKNKTFSSFTPKEIRIHLKNYFEHMCPNFDSVIKAIVQNSNWQEVAKSFVEPGKYIEAAKGVLQMLKDAQQLLESNSKALWPK